MLTFRSSSHSLLRKPFEDMEMSSPLHIPWRKRIALMDPNPSQDGEDRLRGLIDFSNKVKLRFPRRPDMFAAFCETCSLCERKGAEWVLEKLRDLFADHQDLITEFVELQLGVSYPVNGAGDLDGHEAFSELGKELAVLNTGEKPKIKGEKTRTSFVPPVKNAHERMLFDCEDDMGDLDVMIGLARSALSRIGSHLGAERAGDCCLTAGELRCIRRIYGDRGDDIVQLMRAEPVRVLPLVLRRLQQKQDQWVAYRSDARAVWKKAFAEHHRPSLRREDPNTINSTASVKAPVDAGSRTSCTTAEFGEEEPEKEQAEAGEEAPEKEQAEKKLFGRPMSWWEGEAQKGRCPAS